MSFSEKTKSIIMLICLIIIVFVSLALCKSQENKLKKPVFDSKDKVGKIDLVFDRDDNTIIIEKNKNVSFSIDKIKRLDNYSDYEFILIFPGDYIDCFNNLSYKFEDEYIKGIEILNDKDNCTQIIISGNAVLGYIIEEDEQNIYVEAKPPRDVYDNIVVIDPGHGGIDPGTESFGAYEKNINLRISEKVISLLDKNPDIKAYSTRIDDIKIPLNQRVNFSNWLGDLFVSVHINANKRYPDVNGVEVYYYNRKNTERELKSEKYAQMICDSIANATGAKNRGIKNEYLEVISTNNVPAVLCELGFITNYQESLKLGDYDYQWKIAHGIYDAIVEIFNNKDDFSEENSNEN